MSQRETTSPPAKPGLSRREKVFVAVLGSILLHLVILLLLGLFTQNQPAPLAKTADDPIRVEFQPEEEPTPTPGQELVPAGTPTPPPYIATNADQESATPPDKTDFQSDKNALAASELPANGNSPLPNQQGKERPSFAFQTQPYTPGEKAAQTSQPSNADNSKPDPAAPAVSPPPETTPPRPQADRTAPRDKPKPAATPAPTAAPDEIAMLAATPTPAPEPSTNPFDEPAPSPQPTPYDLTVRQPNPPTRQRPSPLRAGAVRPPSAGYQPQTERNLISSSSISNRGASSVAALGTPLGRYTKAMNDAIGSRWYMYVNKRADLANIGMVKVKFVVDRTGKVRAPKIVQSSANESLGTICLAAIMEAQLPPIPPEVIAVLSGGQLDEELTFYVE